MLCVIYLNAPVISICVIGFSSNKASMFAGRDEVVEVDWHVSDGMPATESQKLNGTFRMIIGSRACYVVLKLVTVIFLCVCVCVCPSVQRFSLMFVI